jgi:hypothetical protein
MAEIWYLQAGYQRRENLTFSPLMQLFGAWVKNRKFYRLGSDLDRICPRSQDQETYPHCGVLLQSHSNSWTPPTGSTKKNRRKGWCIWSGKHPKKWRNKQLGQLGMLTYPGIGGIEFNPLPFSQAGRSDCQWGIFFRQIPQSCQRCEGKMIQWSL